MVSTAVNAMIRVDFHTGVEDGVAYACRLLRKATRAGARVHVQGDPGELEVLDKALWTFEPQDFVAHGRLRAGASCPVALAPTPVWLIDEAASWPDTLAAPTVLLRLGPQTPIESATPARIIEIVGDDEGSRQSGRSRWRDYQARGWSVRHHDAASAKEPAP